MKLTIVSMSRNEEDIAAEWARYHWKQGADRIIVSDSSDDCTPDILVGEGCEVYANDDPFMFQSLRMSELAVMAGEGWIVGVDCDEFWSGTEGRTLRDVFDSTPETVGKHYATVYHHVDRDHRWLQPKLPKVAFRWQPDLVVEMGQHEAHVHGQGMSGHLQVRELQFRGRDHYHQKVRERIATIDPNLSHGDATHYRRLDGMTSEQLDAEWFALLARDTIFDPIP